MRRKLASGKIKLTGSTTVIKSGEITESGGKVSEYEISHGWDAVTAMNCDTSWGQFKIETLEFIVSQNYSDEKLNEVLQGLSLEDHHWDWFAKSMHLNSNKYEWWFLTIDGVPQGACIICHPKGSEIDGKNIFYIEYVATAPWNRDNPYQDKKFLGVGTILINCALDYSVNSLNLAHGF